MPAPTPEGKPTQGTSCETHGKGPPALKLGPAQPKPDPLLSPLRAGVGGQPCPEGAWG